MRSATSKSPKHIQDLSPEKRALLALRLKKVVESNSFPLSFAQQQLWFLNQIEPESPFYNLMTATRLTGRLDASALERALVEMAQRHESLRTVFRHVKGQLMQVILPAISLTMARRDLRELPETGRETEAHRLAVEEARRPFDLEQGPLFRATLLQLGDEEHALLLSTHHIVSDGWSDDVLMHELSQLYGAFSTNQEPSLPPLPLQYADYAVWQRNVLRGETLEKKLAYWRGHLAGVARLDLPTDHPRPPAQSFRGAQGTRLLSAGLSHELNALSQREGVTLFMTLLAAWQTLLSRYSGQTDMVVGTPIAGRTRKETEGLIGFFVNTLVMRTRLDGDPNFREILSRARKVALEAYGNQEAPFGIIVEELQPERSLSHNPLFQVAFGLQNAPRESLEFGGLRSNRMTVERGTAKFDLTLSTLETEQGLNCTIEYSTDLFEAATIERMLGHFEILLQGVVADPQQELSRLPLLTEAERRLLIVEWNDTRCDYTRESSIQDLLARQAERSPNSVELNFGARTMTSREFDWQCIHRLFEAQVERDPNAVAVEFAGGSLSYRELNRRANRLARHLQTLGVGPETPVGVCMDRAQDAVLGILAILKAGAAYVPLDPSYPLERLEYILNDTEILVLLSQEWLQERLPASWAQVVNLDAEWEAIMRQSDENPASEVTADNLAYIIYTSGSTGKPKGVLLQHGGVHNLAEALKASSMVERGSRVLQFASFNFDASVWETFPALIAGATLCLGESGTLLAGERLSETLREMAVTTVTLPPSVLAMTPSEGLSDLKTIISAGEACSAEIIERWGRGRRFINAYGPTESTVCATMAEGPESERGNAIGRPLPNIESYVLDVRLEPLPVGIAGELYVGGEGLARGYRNRPDQTAERFIPHPYSNRPGARLYRTGDLARYLADGQIEFLGRLDHQVKIHGFRIELEEIEAALSQHPEARDCIVVAREDQTGDKRLVAYVVAESESPITSSEFIEHLKERLPGYMIPSAFVTLSEMPLTPNGKIDRKALPAPDYRRRALEHAFVAPRTPLEEELVKIWAEVLRLPQVGVNDNFFDLGGHSLSAIQVISRMREVAQVELPLRSFFEGPTVSKLAESVEKARGSRRGIAAGPISADEREESLGTPDEWPHSQVEPHGAWRSWRPLTHDIQSATRTSLICLQPEGRKAPFFCVHAAGGSVFGFVDLAYRFGAERPFYGFQSRGLFEEGAPHTSVEEMASFYITALRSVQTEGPYLLGGWSMGGVVAYEMAQQLTASGEKVALVALIDTRAPGSDGRTDQLDEETLLGGYAQDLALSWNPQDFSWGHFLQLTPKEKLGYVLEWGKAHGILRADFNFANIHHFIETFKANVLAMSNYRPRPYGGRVALFSAGEPSIENPIDPSKGWGASAVNGVECYAVPGNHYTMLREPHVSVLTARIEQCVEGKAIFSS
jgi:amino acid adenylation domain-containing protein